MQKVLTIIARKPIPAVLFVSIYAALSALIKWRFVFSLSMFWYIVGALIGLYFFDFAEWFFSIRPSPFRSLLFLTLYALCSVFVVTSSIGSFGVGVVLALAADISYFIATDVLIHHKPGWFVVASGSNDTTINPRIASWVFICLFVLLTYIFLR